MADPPAEAQGRIFISYRRNDSAYPAGWLFDRLAERFGKEQIFKDVDSIELGEDFVEEIGEAVGQADVLLALIGERWLNAPDEHGGRRLDDPEDFVRIEIEAALARKLRVIPILVEGAGMPREEQLPESLRPLARRQALELNQLGTQLRREGAHEQAAEQHRAALEIVRDLGDQRAEALTLNNLALALAHSGSEEAAVEHLEHAREVLHELGDEEHEGQVIANLGLVHRRQGHSEEAVTLLHEALDKLPPGSTAYRQVEEELVRAS